MTDELGRQDAKCTLEIMDHSIQDGLKVTIFWAEENMPSVCGPADVVVIRNIKVSNHAILFLFLTLTFSGPDVEWTCVALST
jgi:hypothetical protein